MQKQILTVLTLLFLFPLQGRAATVSDVQAIAAQVVKAAQDDAAAAGARLAADGPPAVTQEGGIYNVELPHLALTTADGGVIDFGRPHAAFEPEGRDWKIGLMFQPFQIARPGAAPATVDPGKQEITAVWSAEDGAIGSLQLHCAGAGLSGGLTGRIGDIALDFDLHRAFGGGRRGPLTVSATDVGVATGDGSAFHMASLSLHGDLETLAANAPRAGIAGLSLHGIAQTITLQRRATKSMPARGYALPEADLDIAARGNGADRDEAQVDARYAGLTTQPAEADPAAPAHMTFSAHFSSLPAGGLIAMVRTLSASLLGDESKKQAREARAALLHLLEQAHTRIDVKTLAFGNNVYEARGNGAVTMTDAAPNGAIGSATATATGLDQLLAALNGEPPTLQITVLQLVGKPVANGARRFDVEWRADGPLLFNGQDIAGLLQGADALSGFKIKMK